jgi:type II secretory ATPase GspE/PulE/Tfp pilus assembly ATPase PilB-like protein
MNPPNVLTPPRAQSSEPPRSADAATPTNGQAATAITPSTPANPESLSIAWAQKNLLPEQILNMVINHAVQLGASDIFFFSNENNVGISIRHLGIIKQVTTLPVEQGVRCFAYIRTMAQMKFGERRHPQDGRWVFNLGDGRILDLRLNALPTLYGESIAIRVLHRESHLRNLDALGFVGPQLGTIVSALHANSGLVLVTGPTGSGKTTTIYGCLHYLNDGRRKIHTIEDPVEYSVEGFHQSQIDSNGGADFADMLRGVVRQGPDVIMIGEVRDRHTAETAVRAANSGQLVFASLHASVAATAIQSFLTLGVSPYFLCTSLLAVICQRLARTLRPETRVPIDLSSAPNTFDEVRPWLEYGQGTVAYAASAEGDRNEGYAGRCGIFEVMTPSPSIRRFITDMRPASDIQSRAVEEGMLDFRRACLLKVAQGITTFDEMQRILPTGDTWIDT